MYHALQACARYRPQGSEYAAVATTTTKNKKQTKTAEIAPTLGITGLGCESRGKVAFPEKKTEYSTWDKPKQKQQRV